MDSLTYDIYFGTSSNPQLVFTDQSMHSYLPCSLQRNTDYYWRIDAKDSESNNTTSSIFKFTTADKPLILVDASHDGGVWWAGSSGFDPTEPHQGKELADYIRSQDFQVDELPSCAVRAR